jgi:hypothetical protein
MAIYYEDAGGYIQNASNIRDKIKRIDQVIDALFDAATKAAANQEISSYSLDDGQTSITASYRNSQEALKAINDFEELRQKYIDRLNKNSVFQLKPEQNFRIKRR